MPLIREIEGACAVQRSFFFAPNTPYPTGQVHQFYKRPVSNKDLFRDRFCVEGNQNFIKNFCFCSQLLPYKYIIVVDNDDKVISGIPATDIK